MKTAGHTMGVPELTIFESIEFMARTGYDGIEVRFTSDGQLDPSSGPLRINRVRPELIARTRRALSDAGIELVVLSGYHGDFSTADSTTEHMAAIRREVDVAAELGCPMLRVMGGAYSSFWRGSRNHADVEKHTAETLHALGDYASARDVGIILETHASTLVETAAAARRLVNMIGSAAVKITYDQDQLDRNGGEEPEEAVKILGPEIRHVHLCPFRFERKGDTDRGLRVVKALFAAGYDGYLSDEYPRHGSAEVPAAEVQMPANLKMLREWIAKTG